LADPLQLALHASNKCFPLGGRNAAPDAGSRKGGARETGRSFFIFIYFARAALSPNRVGAKRRVLLRGIEVSDLAGRRFASGPASSHKRFHAALRFRMSSPPSRRGLRAAGKRAFELARPPQRGRRFNYRPSSLDHFQTRRPGIHQFPPPRSASSMAIPWGPSHRVEAKGTCRGVDVF